jgi:hypothetical protein
VFDRAIAQRSDTARCSGDGRRLDDDDIARYKAALDAIRAEERALYRDLRDPDARDGHLRMIDHLLLPELTAPLTLIELETVAPTVPGASLLAAPRANTLCPLLWRWLLDAHRRGQVRPRHRPADAHTLWTTIRGAGYPLDRPPAGGLGVLPGFAPRLDVESRSRIVGFVEWREASVQAAAASLPERPCAFEPPSDYAIPTPTSD